MSALRRNKWNGLETARQLGIHKPTLFRKIKSLGLDVPRRAERKGR
jgi:transcriptional regulator of acetoin/glycerol metabolism